MKNTLQLVVADIDGTLRGFGEDPGPLTLSAFKELHERGVKLGIASGRPADNTIGSYYKKWNLGFQFDLIIGMNGGQVWDTVKDTHEEYNLLSRESLKEIVEKMKPLGLNPFVYKKGYMLSEREDEMMKAASVRNDEEARVAKDISDLWETENNKILFRVDTPEQMIKVEAHAKKCETENYTCFKTGPIMLEFQDPRNNKGVALKAYCENNGIDLKDVISFGDADNDTEMLRVSGCSVCLLNGTEENKKLATAVTKYDCGHDGVGHYLWDHVLNEK